jgi:hypothetical protein
VFAARNHWIPAVACLVISSFVTYGSVSHDLVHRNLGLPKRANDLLLVSIELLALRSGTAYRLVHLQHHRVYPGDDDIEGAVAPDLDTQLPDVDGPDWIRSLETVLALPVTSLFDSHGTIIHGYDEVRRLPNQKRDLLRDIQERAGEHLESSASIEDLSNRVFGSHTLADRPALEDGSLSVLTNAEFSRHNLIASFATPMLHQRQTTAP